MIAPFIFSFSVFIINLLVMFYCTVASMEQFNTGHTVIAVFGVLVAILNAYCAFQGVKSLTQIVEYWRK